MSTLEESHVAGNCPPASRFAGAVQPHVAETARRPTSSRVGRLAASRCGKNLGKSFQHACHSTWCSTTADEGTTEKPAPTWREAELPWSRSFVPAQTGQAVRPAAGGVEIRVGTISSFKGLIESVDLEVRPVRRQRYSAAGESVSVTIKEQGSEVPVPARAGDGGEDQPQSPNLRGSRTAGATRQVRAAPVNRTAPALGPARKRRPDFASRMGLDPAGVGAGLSLGGEFVAVAGGGAWRSAFDAEASVRRRRRGGWFAGRGPSLSLEGVARGGGGVRRVGGRAASTAAGRIPTDREGPPPPRTEARGGRFAAAPAGKGRPTIRACPEQPRPPCSREQPQEIAAAPPPPGGRRARATSFGLGRAACARRFAGFAPEDRSGSLAGAVRVRAGGERRASAVNRRPDRPAVGPPTGRRWVGNEGAPPAPAVLLLRRAVRLSRGKEGERCP